MYVCMYVTSKMWVRIDRNLKINRIKIQEITKEFFKTRKFYHSQFTLAFQVLKLEKRRFSQQKHLN